MSIYGYTPPVGFGNQTTDPTKKKAQPGDPGYVDPGVGTTDTTTGNPFSMPGLAPVSTYTPTQFDPNSVDLSSPVQLAPGSRDSELMADAGYQQLLASLGLDEQTARARTAFGETAAQNKLNSSLGDLQRQSQEDRYGIDATLRSRGVRGSQREALQSRAYENQGRAEQNLRGMSTDEVNGLQNQLADTLSQLRRAEATGAGDAAARLQTQRDAIQARLVQQQTADQTAAAAAAQNAQVIAALNQMAAQTSQPAGPVSTGDPTLDKLNAMSPEEQAAFRQFIAASQQPAALTAAPAAPAAPARAPARAPSTRPPAGYVPQAPPPLALTPLPRPPRSDAIYGPR